MKNAYIDFHCHILPGMDFDGTDDLKESVAMCTTLKSQGVATVCATPHFYPWNDDVDEFLARRSETYEKLAAAGGDIEIILGAEVQIFKSLADYPVDKMCIGDSNVVMLEMPRLPYADWMFTAIENTVYKYHLIPVIAHIERYGYSKETIKKLATLPNVFFQISVDELDRKSAIKTLDTICSCGVPVVLGSDAHNTIERAPHFDIVSEKLKVRAGFFDKSLKTTQAIIENCLFAAPILEEYIRKKVKKATEVK